MNTPNIRFKGFGGDWEQRKLGDMVSFSKGTGYSKADLQDSGTPIILYGRLYTKYETVISEVDTFADEKPNSVFSKGGEVIVPASGETAEDISVASVVEQSGVMLGGDLNIITTPQELDSAFLAISISNGKPHSDMAKMAQGKSVVHLHNSDLAKINLPYPSYEEQQWISSHFKSIDNLIALYQRKSDSLKQVKKYMLKKMFPKQGEKVPEIRFAGFTDNWEQRKLGEVVERITRKNTGMESTLPLTISAQYGLVNQNEFFDKRIASKDVSGYYLVYKGEFAYNKSTSSDAPWGAIKRLDRYENGVLSTLYIVFTIKDNEKTDSDYLSTYYDSSLWHKEVQAIAAEGARNHGLLNISPSDFFETKLSIPSNIDEQRKIGAYFSNLDNLITLHQRKSDSLKEIKKFMLQNMFP